MNYYRNITRLLRIRSTESFYSIPILKKYNRQIKHNNIICSINIATYTDIWNDYLDNLKDKLIFNIKISKNGENITDIDVLSLSQYSVTEIVDHIGKIYKNTYTRIKANWIEIKWWMHPHISYHRFRDLYNQMYKHIELSKQMNANYNLLIVVSDQKYIQLIKDYIGDNCYSKYIHICNVNDFYITVKNISNYDNASKIIRMPHNRYSYTNYFGKYFGRFKSNIIGFCYRYNLIKPINNNIKLQNKLLKRQTRLALLNTKYQSLDNIRLNSHKKRGATIVNIVVNDSHATHN